MEDVLEVYQRPPDPTRPVVCLDETSKQLVAETRTPIPAKSGRVARHDYEYERNGTANLFMMFAPLEGWRHVEVTDHRTAVDYAQILKALSDMHFPKADKIVLVQDNLNTHRPASLYEIRAEAAQTVVDFQQDRATRQAGAVRARPHAAMEFGCDHHILAPREVLYRTADDFLRVAIGIDVRRVQEVDAKFKRLLNQRPAAILVQRPGMVAPIRCAVGHASKADAGNLQTGAPESCKLHREYSFSRRNTGHWRDAGIRGSAAARAAMRHR
jgi:hypothetical protein